MPGKEIIPHPEFEPDSDPIQDEVNRFNDSDLGLLASWQEYLYGPAILAVKKPSHGREGVNVTEFDSGEALAPFNRSDLGNAGVLAGTITELRGDKESPTVQKTVEDNRVYRIEYVYPGTN